MSWVDEIKNKMSPRRRHKDDAEVDGPELAGAGISIKPGDPRLKKGINDTSSLTPEELRKLRAEETPSDSHSISS